MSTPNPFIPAGSLIAESQRRNRTQFKVGVYAVLAAHTMLLLGLLIQGCRSDQSATVSTGEETGRFATAATNSVTVRRPRVVTPAATAAVPVAAELPSTPAPAPMMSMPALAPDSSYTVKAGDTLSRIAKAHGTTASALQAANHLNGNRLSIGQKLVLPPRALASAAPASR